MGDLLTRLEGAVMDGHHEVPADELAEMRRELTELRAEVQRLQQIAHGATMSEPVEQLRSVDESVGPSGSRRHLIRGAVGLGAGVAAASFVSRPAAAAPTGMQTETAHTASADTSLESSSLEAFIGRSTSSTNLSSGLKGEATASSGEIFGVHGRSVSSPDGRGVRGQGPTGVEGVTDDVSGIGVVGFALQQDGTGVRGVDGSATGDGFGVVGESMSSGGVGVIGTAKGIGGVFDGEKSALRLQTTNTEPPLSRFVDHDAGEIDVDADGNLWVCVESGLPGAWRKLAGPESAGSIHLVNPYRAYDSRFGDGVLSTGENREVTLTDRLDPSTGQVVEVGLLPPEATGVFFNLTVTNTSLRGFLSVTPIEATEAGGSSINWPTSGFVVANGTQVKLTPDTSGVKVFAGGGAGSSTAFIIDVTGYTL